MARVKQQVAMLSRNLKQQAYSTRAPRNPPPMKRDTTTVRKVEYTVTKETNEWAFVNSRQVAAAILAQFGISAASKEQFVQDTQFRLQKATIWSTGVGLTEVGLAVDSGIGGAPDNTVMRFVTDKGTEARAAVVSQSLPLLVQQWCKVDPAASNHNMFQYIASGVATIQLVVEVMTQCPVIVTAIDAGAMLALRAPA